MESSSDPANPGPAPSPQTDPGRDSHFELSLDLLCIAGLDGYFKQVNPAWTRVLGWSRSELLARPVADFIHPEDRERTLQARAHLANGVLVRGLENRYLCKDGTYRWLSWQSSIEPAGTMVFAVARDITEQRRMDREHLILSKQESTGILAGGIAHDFNNLLTSITLNLDMLGLSGSLNPEQLQHLRQAQEGARAAHATTKRLLTSASGGDSVRKLTDLKKLLRQSLEITLSGSNVRGDCQLAPELWPAEVDEAQFAQVVRGLVMNAREAMPSGGTVHVQAENIGSNAPSELHLSPGNYLRICVTDDGPGIPPQILSKIFDPYFSTKTRSSEKGMGLGLTICRSVIQKYGGAIVVDSRPGRGTTFSCYLPATGTSEVGTTPPPV